MLVIRRHSGREKGRKEGGREGELPSRKSQTKTQTKLRDIEFLREGGFPISFQASSSV